MLLLLEENQQQEESSYEEPAYEEPSSEEPVSEGEVRIISVYVEENDSVSDIGQMLEEKGLIRDGRLFMIQELLSEHHGKIQPGIYDLNTFTTDEAIMPTRGGDWYDGGFWQGLYLHRWGVNNEAIYATWEYLYRTVILCNGSLERIQDFAEKAERTNTTQTPDRARHTQQSIFHFLLSRSGCGTPGGCSA